MDNNYCPLVTIAIPTYNRADGYLREALESALSQTYENIEIVISDNCSTDDTELLIRGISDSRLRYIRHSENIGAINNFNFCLQEANGVYFLMLHDDDLIDKDFIETCLLSADYSTDYAMIQTGIRVIGPDKAVWYETQNSASGLLTSQYFLAWFAGKTAWFLPNTLFNTERLREVGGFHSLYNLTPDGFAIVKLASRFKRLDIEEVKASFRKHPGELTFAAKVKDWCDDYLALLDLMCDVVSNDKAQIRVEGQRFFCRINYNRAHAIRSPFEKFSTYFMVYRKFNYSESLIKYLYSIYLSPIITKSKNTIKRKIHLSVKNLIPN